MAFKGSRQRHKGQPLFKHRPLWTERTAYFTVWYNPSTALTGICLCAYSGGYCFGSLSHSLRHVQHDSMVPNRTVAAEAALLAWIAVHYVICRSTLVYSFLSPYKTNLEKDREKERECNELLCISKISLKNLLKCFITLIWRSHLEGEWDELQCNISKGHILCGLHVHDLDGPHKSKPTQTPPSSRLSSARKPILDKLLFVQLSRFRKW